MKFKAFLYSAFDNPYRFNYTSVPVWLIESDWQSLMSSTSPKDAENDDVFVKLQIQDSLNQVVLYSKLSCLNSGTLCEQEGSGYLWMAQEILPKEAICVSKKTIVEVSILPKNSLPYANSIVLQLKESDVERWSEEEFETAIVNYRKHNHIAYIKQRVILNSGTKDPVVAEIKSIVPESSYDSAFLLCKETEIILDGKPIDPQQTIDFSKIGGQKKVIQELREIIQLPMNYPEYFAKFNVKPPKGILLYGPPGNGKTMMARALSKSLGASFINIDLSDALQKYKGVGEYNLGKKFEEAENKRSAVIFIDEIDAIASIREKDKAGHEISLVAKLLSLMDGIRPNSRVFVIGATNRLDAIDPALRRPGRFDKEMEVPLPDLEARCDILTKYIQEEHQDNFDFVVDCNFIKNLASELEGYSGADICALYREATMSAIRKHLKFNDDTGKSEMLVNVQKVKISIEDFKTAKARVKTTMARNSHKE